MRRVLVVVAAVVGLAACGPVSPAALTVDGDEIVSRADLFDDIEALAAVPAPEREGTLTQQAVAQQLTYLAQTEILERYLDAEDIAITDEYVSAAREQVGDPAQLPVQEDLYVRWLSSQFAMEQLVPAEPPTEEEIQAAYDSIYPADLELSCTRHILVTTEAEADDVLDRLDAGEEFADVAAEVSIDPGSGQAGGELGCNPQGAFVPQFDDAVWAAEPGDVIGPVESDFGFHVIEVLDRRAQVLDDVRADIEAQLQSAEDAARQETFTSLIREAVAAVDIEIDSRFGTWDPQNVQVVPPEGSFVPNPLVGDDGVITVDGSTTP